ncbi:type II toxin-antitoxin system RelE/ParE family toxin [Rubrivirga sp.]|uniref:type II toxin-antitoxin system RelE/ParE family toxin n=1 Tax=Rubrivirga sp. TaxID=1885344 RepID=UPI003B5189BC
MTDVRLHPDARAELLDAATYYEDQSEGLGGQLIDEAQRVFDLLAESPGLGSPVPEHDAYRRWSLRRFPYRVIYRENEDVLFVLAVAHERRRPGYWSGRS